MTRRILVLFTMDICVSPLFRLLGYSQNGRPHGPSLPVAVECFSETSPAQAQESRVRIVNSPGSRPIRRYRLHCRRFAPVVAAEFAQCNHEGAQPLAIDARQFPAGFEERPGQHRGRDSQCDLENAVSAQRGLTENVVCDDLCQSNQQDRQGQRLVFLPVQLHSVKEHFFSFAVLWMSTGQQRSRWYQQTLESRAKVFTLGRNSRSYRTSTFPVKLRVASTDSLCAMKPNQSFA